MLRCLSLCLMIALSGTVPGPLSGPVAAQPAPDARSLQPLAGTVWEVMQLDRLTPILRDEALAEGAEIAATMLQQGGTGLWLPRVAAIHDPDRVRQLFLDGMAAAIPADQQNIMAGLDFYRGDMGRRMLALEASARTAMLEGDVEAAARDAFAQAIRLQTPRATQIDGLIRTADLVDQNVAGGMNASVAFSRGFQAGGGFPMPLSDAQILEDAWAQEAQIRADTQDWLGAYLFLAYGSLSDRELDAYIAYAASPGGRALSALMFAGFDAAFVRTSYDMGLAAAAEMQGRQL